MKNTLPLFPNQLDPKIESFFFPLCEDDSKNQIDELLIQLDSHIEKVRKALLFNEFIDTDIAEQITTTLKRLLNEEFNLGSEKNRKLIVGATRYFIRDYDAQPDFGSILGFDDDVAVLNFVLIEIGRIDLKVEI